MNEYGFELRLCAHLETRTDGIVARQLGGGVHDGGGRILDIVVIEPGPEFDRRCAITAETIPPLAIESDVGAGRARRWANAVDLHPETARRVREEALRVGFFELDRRGRVRQSVRYPDWIGEIVAIENKPDLGAPGGLTDQLRRDVSLGLVDRVVLATASHVTGAHLNRIPGAVGVWRVDPAGPSVEVIREPERLDPTAWGLEVCEREPTRTQVRTVPPAAKRRARVRLAERAYGKGWRPAFPGCAKVAVAEAAGTASLPHCTWKQRVVEPAGCGPACPGYAAAAPPEVDPAAERAARTGWVAAPPGVAGEQAGLSRFGGTDDRSGK